MSTFLSNMVAFVQVVTYIRYCVTFCMGLKYPFVKLLYLTYYIRHCGPGKRWLDFCAEMSEVQDGSYQIKICPWIFFNHFTVHFNSLILIYQLMHFYIQ